MNISDFAQNTYIQSQILMFQFTLKIYCLLQYVSLLKMYIMLSHQAGHEIHNNQVMLELLNMER